MADNLTDAWRRTEAALPEGWRLDSLRCGSKGLDEASRSDDWLAVAVGPGGREEIARAADPTSALTALADRLG